jgi:DNA-binding NarL/FixJ family response regulator
VRDRPGGCATDREVGVVSAVLVAGSEKAAAHRLGLSHSTVKHHLANARSKVGAETMKQRADSGSEAVDGRAGDGPGPGC